MAAIFSDPSVLSLDFKGLKGTLFCCCLLYFGSKKFTWITSEFRTPIFDTFPYIHQPY